MAVTIWSMFSLSTAYWGVSLGFLLSKVKLQPIEDRLRIWSNVMNAVVTVNVSNLNPPNYRDSNLKWIYLLQTVVADAVLVWRVKVLCRDEFPRLISVATFSLGLTFGANVSPR